MPGTSAAPRNKNWLLVKFREWHSWGGLFLSGFILLVAVTGILLNHKDFFFHRGEGHKQPTGLLSVSTDISTLPVSFADALALARDHYGDVPIEKIELKDERGHLVYKVARGEGQEVRIDASTGVMTSKYGMKLNQAQAGPGQLNWAKLVDDLHTGKIFGTLGKLVIDLTSGVIIALTLTGLYLWGIPWLRKRRSKKRNASAASASSSSSSSVATSELLAKVAARKAAARRQTAVDSEDRVEVGIG